VIRAWIEHLWRNTRYAQTTASPPVVTRTLGAVPAKYVALHKYLTERFADAVTMSFTQIEDVLGSELPAVARVEPDWWITRTPSADHLHTQAWVLAGRTAEPQLGAQIVRFERGRSTSHTRHPVTDP
jgi:hypothetical protein